MNPITDNQTAAQARYDIERALTEGEFSQLSIGDATPNRILRENIEVSVEWGKLIFAWWDESNSQSWRISGYEIHGNEIRLQATRGIARERTTLVLRDTTRPLKEMDPARLSRRRQFALTLSKLIASEFKDAKVDTLRSASGKYLRLRLKLNCEPVLAIGVHKDESQADIDGIVAAGLIWLGNYNAERELDRQARRLWFCLPRDRSRTAIERLTLIDTTQLGARVECFEIDEIRSELKALRPSTQIELLNTHPHDLLWPGISKIISEWHERIIGLAPDIIETQPLPDRVGLRYLINGLEFARMSSKRVGGKVHDKVTFGVAGCGIENIVTLSEFNFDDLESLLREIVAHRSQDEPDHGHPYFRLREESWLESLLRRNINALDASLDDRYVYSQIPTWRADERSVIDLLTINHDRRLVVIEIKAVEDPQLPMQGLDYWLRIEQARLRREFENRGIFAGIAIADKPPMLYLVAPRLRFHRTFSLVAGCLSPSIEAYQIGINANWRNGIRVRSKELVNRGRENAK